MRRKGFGLLLIMVIFLYFLDYAGVPLCKNHFRDIKEDTYKIVGIVEKIQWKEEEEYAITLRVEFCDGQRVQGDSRILITYYDNLDNPAELYKSRISFSCNLREAQKRRNPHCFDYNKYLKTLKIFAIGRIDTYCLERRDYTALEKYQRFLVKKRFEFQEILKENTRGLVLGILFGDTVYMGEELYEEFRSNGTAHILAVSGLHIAIIYGLYRKIVGQRNSLPALLVLGILLFSYGSVSMWSPSLIRATLMIALNVVADILDLRYDLLSAMSISGLYLIFTNPYIIFGTAFQMSFLAITSIAFFQKIMPHGIPDFLTVSLAVNLGLTIYQMYHFNYISLISIIANIPIIYLSSYFVPMAMVTLVLFSLGGQALARLPKELTELMAELIIRINQLASFGGCLSFDCRSPSAGIVFLVMGLMFFLSSETCLILKIREKRSDILKAITAIIISSLIAEVLVYSPLSDDDLVFLDVGQGDAIHLRMGKKNVLIDGGGSKTYNIGKKVLKPYFLKNGVRKVDIALATHMHLDHFKGIEELCLCFPVKSVLTGSVAGDEIILSDKVRIETLWPLSLPETSAQDENSQCSVFMIHYNGVKILITGDLDQKGESKMLDYYGNSSVLKADILKIGHHGSKTGTSEEFLDRVKPQYGVIQVGENNYGHPAQQTIDICLKKGIILLRNDESGAVGFSFKKGRIRYETVISDNFDN